jgi:metallo-beta-lactamase family protein
MAAKLHFFGGAGEVTGSRHLIEADGASVLMDCGLFQGHRHEAVEKNKNLPFDPRTLAAVLLSHAHIDHSGGLPLLPKNGYKGPIFATPATADLCGVMLMDSAHLQEEDAKFFNKIHGRLGDAERIQPLYGEDDARNCLRHFQTRPFDQEFEPAQGLRARFLNAGHVLGSAMIQVDVPTGGGSRRILFTGDLGRRDGLLMAPPVPPQGVDYLLIESTYGGRPHDPIETAYKSLADVVARTAREKGKLLIPSFALERTQEIAFLLEKLFREKTLPRIPVYIDSPLAVEITEIFRRNIKSFSFAADFKAYAEKSGDPFGLETMRYVRTSDESKALNDVPGPIVIISASGMCEGGRILHHLRNNIETENTTILIVGYQAEGTLGRRLLDGAKKVKIFGLEHEVWARVEAIHSFSAHADKDDLLWFIGALSPRPRRIFLVHGDPEERTALEKLLAAQGIDRVESPEFRETFELE